MKITFIINIIILAAGTAAISAATEKPEKPSESLHNPQLASCELSIESVSDDMMEEVLSMLTLKTAAHLDRQVARSLRKFSKHYQHSIDKIASGQQAKESVYIAVLL